MNTILISGTVNTYTAKDNIFTYAVNIWGCNTGESLQFITSKNIFATCYGDMWQQGKDIAAKYLKNDLLTDGAYTQYLDHLIILPD